MSSTGVPSIASRFRTAMTSGWSAVIVTVCRPIGLGRSGERGPDPADRPHLV